MEELEPEQLPMDQVLGEIRNMLMSDMDKDELQPNRTEPAFEPYRPVEPMIPKKVEPAYFLLTPAMRCDLPSDSELSETVQRRAQQVLSKLQKETTPEKLSPALTDWLETHLPELVEQVVSKKISEQKN